MAFWNHLPYLARRLDRRRAEKDLDDELQAHLDLEIEGNLAAGMSPDEARRAARRKLGNLSIARQDVRAVWELPFVETTWKDLRHAARLLRARPGYAFAAILSLALGIGVCTAVWTVVDRVLLRRTPVHRLAVGDIVVVRLPGMPRVASPRDRPWLIKRVAALPGDPVPSAVAPAVDGAHVPPNRLVLLSDNPVGAIDSRQFGYLTPDLVLGRVVRRLA